VIHGLVGGHPGTDANSTVLAGLRSVLEIRAGQHYESVSSAVTVSRPIWLSTLVRPVPEWNSVLCKTLPVLSRERALHTHALLLSRLKNTLPVPSGCGIRQADHSLPCWSPPRQDSRWIWAAGTSCPVPNDHGACRRSRGLHHDSDRATCGCSDAGSILNGWRDAVAVKARGGKPPPGS
jgi:hypothetical protein